jgi:hypothetical protein
VKGVDHVYARMTREREGAIGPFDEGRWRLAYIQDPDGNWLELGEKERRLRPKKSRRARTTRV